MSILKVVQAQPTNLAMGPQPQFQVTGHVPIQGASTPGILGMVRTTAPQPKLPPTTIQGSHYSQTAPQIGPIAWNLNYLADPNANWQPPFNPADFNTVHWGYGGQVTVPPHPQNGSYLGRTQSIWDRLRGLF